VTAALADHPRHVLLGALTAGLLVGPRWPAALLVLVAAGLLVAAAAHGIARLPTLAPLAAGVALALLLGGVVARERLRVLDRTALRPAASFTVRGFAVEPVRQRAFGIRVVPVRLTTGAGVGERVLVRAPAWVGLAGVGIGDEVVARGELRALREREGFERRRNVHAVLEAERVDRTGRSRASMLDGVRRRAERALGDGLGPEQAALARGMVLGQDHALPDDLRDAFRRAGLAHLVAASGQNVMLLAALAIAAATAAGAMLRTRLALALAAVALYVPLAGAGPSIQRAGVMGAAGLVAALAGRPASRWYALLLAATATLILNPRAAEDPGWQLSFAAVVAILALHRRLRDALAARGTPRALAEAGALTIAATAGTAPLMALHFEQVSLVSLPANLLAAPAVAPVMWLGAAAASLGAPAAAAINLVAPLPLAYLAWLGRTAAGVPYASVPITLPGPLAAAAMYAGMGLAVVGARRVGRWARRATAPLDAEGEDDGPGAAGTGPLRVGGAVGRGPLRAGGAVMAAVVLLVAAGGAGGLTRGHPPRGFALTVLDIGQGDAILLQHGADHAILFDTGPPGAGIVGKLRKAGVRRLDALVLTHSSLDHEGALREVLAAFTPGLVVDGRQTPREQEEPGGGLRFEDLPQGVPRTIPEAGQRLRAGPIAIDVLWPPPGRPRSGDPNMTAMVALARDGPTTALLTADAESPVTLPLDLPHVDILKVAHHGSEDEGLPQLLEEVQPRVATVSVGEGNTYGHPAPTTMQALEATVPEVRRTDEHGTVTIESTQEGGLAIR
jgi:competence protein ComEC